MTTPNARGPETTPRDLREGHHHNGRATHAIEPSNDEAIDLPITRVLTVPTLTK